MQEIRVMYPLSFGMDLTLLSQLLLACTFPQSRSSNFAFILLPAVAVPEPPQPPRDIKDAFAEFEN